MGDDKSQQIENVTREVIAKLLNVKAGEINPEAHFIKDLGVDSVDAVQLSVALEKKFGVTIDDMLINELSSVNATVRVVSNLLN